MRRALCVALWQSLLVVQFTPALYVDRSTTLVHRPRRCSGGTAVVDTDGDGRFELLVVGCAGSPNQLLQYDDQNKSFADLAPGSHLADLESPGIGGAGCDVDGDGREEIYIVNSDVFGGTRGQMARDRLYRRDGQGWTDLMDMHAYPANSALRHGSAGRAVGCVYSVRESSYAFLVPSTPVPDKDPYAWLVQSEADLESETAFRLFTMRPQSNRVLNVAEEEGFTRKVSARGLVITPPLVPSEKDAPQYGVDVLVAAHGGANILFRSIDGTHLTSQVVGVSDEFEASRAVAVADFDADGNLDVVMCSWNGPTRLWHQVDLKGSSEWVDVAEGTPMAERSYCSNVVIGDLDNDGHLEVMIVAIDAAGEGASNRIFKVFMEQTLEGPEMSVKEVHAGDAGDQTGQNTGVAVADFDGDGALDVYMARGATSTTEGLFLQLHPSVPPYNWLRVLVQDANGAPARGADVIMEQSGRKQRRVLDGGSGYRAQQEPVAHFGMGDDDSSPVTLRVRWPNGEEATIEAEINRQITVQFDPTKTVQSESGPIATPVDDLKGVQTEEEAAAARAKENEALKASRAKLAGMNHAQKAAALVGVSSDYADSVLDQPAGEIHRTHVESNEGPATMTGSDKPSGKSKGSHSLLSKMLSPGSKQKGAKAEEREIGTNKKPTGSHSLLSKMMGRKPKPTPVEQHAQRSASSSAHMLKNLMKKKPM